MKNRRAEIDFLRGIAILLVISRHLNFINNDFILGWVGVDLFFVISGFLVSNILFVEYKFRKKINYINFIIRRLVRILPVYYFCYALYYLYYFYSSSNSQKIDFYKILSDLVLLQNYSGEFSFIMGQNWSLAVEEQFYLFAIVVAYLFLKNKDVFNFVNKHVNKIFLAFMLFIFFLRLSANFYFSVNYINAITMSHLRADALAMGVYISYLYNLKLHELEKISSCSSSFLPFLSALTLLFVFYSEPFESRYMRSFGFSLLAVFFGLILIKFITNRSFFEKIQKLVTDNFAKFICFVGRGSYSIYLIHVIIIHLIECSMLVLDLKLNFLSKVIYVFISYALTILTGHLIFKCVESPILKIRNKLFPQVAS